MRSPRAYLATIITRLAINQLRSARTQREVYAGPWLPEPLVTEPRADPSDSGGKVPGAALEPVHGASAVGRFAIGVVQRFVPAGSVIQAAEINGQAGFIVYVTGRAMAALVFDVREGRIHTIYAIGNPGKLQSLPTPM